MEHPYIVINPEGKIVLQSTVRYPKSVEMDLIAHGYTIKLNGKKLTMQAIRKEMRK